MEEDYKDREIARLKERIKRLSVDVDNLCRKSSFWYKECIMAEEKNKKLREALANIVDACK